MKAIFDAGYSAAGLAAPTGRVTSFNHSFGYGYGGITYSYIWSMIIAADYQQAITDMEASGLSTRDIGQKLLDTLFGMGAALAPGEVFAEFAGRPYNGDAFNVSLGF